jgi:hypothetical protein
MFVSLENSRQTSIVPNQGFNKINARFNGNYKFNDEFSAELISHIIFLMAIYLLQVKMETLFHALLYL